MELWDEMRTAYLVAELGTVSAAAEALGVHRATVSRHIDALEAALGGRLFQRHGRGYTPTEAGQDLMRVARATDEQFRQLVQRTRGRRAQVSGEVVVTSVELVAPLILPALRVVREAHPDTVVRFETSRRLYALEYGEAHVAIRAGGQPHPDNVIQPWLVLRSALYAHRRYVEQHGMPSGPEAFGEHAFVADGTGTNHAPTRWLREMAPEVPIRVSSRNGRVQIQAVREGLGIGFLPVRVAALHPDLVEVHPPLPDWDVPFSLVTHVDLHGTAKVQAVLQALKAAATP